MAFWESSFSGSSGGNYRLRQQVDVLGQEVGNNRTLIRYNAWVAKVGGSGVYNLVDGAAGNTNINGYNPGRSWGTYDFRAYSVRYIAQNEDYWVYHNSSGDANPYFAVYWDLRNGGTLGSATTGGNTWMPHINRYAGITGYTLDQITDTSIRLNWNADANVDYISWWSSKIDGGAHHDIPTSGSGTWRITPTNLKSDTQYDFKVAVRRQDSGLWTESGTLYATTLGQNNFLGMMMGELN